MNRTEKIRQEAENLWAHLFEGQPGNIETIMFALRAAECRALKRVDEWATVIFYPGPNEDPAFQAGYMEAVHEVQRVVNRLLKELES